VRSANLRRPAAGGHAGTEAEVQATAAEFGITLTAIGELVTARGGRPMIEIR
jgi:selenide,water dikinase